MYGDRGVCDGSEVGPYNMISSIPGVAESLFTCPLQV